MKTFSHLIGCFLWRFSSYFSILFEDTAVEKIFNRSVVVWQVYEFVDKSLTTHLLENRILVIVLTMVMIKRIVTMVDDELMVMMVVPFYGFFILTWSYLLNVKAVVPRSWVFSKLL